MSSFKSLATIAAWTLFIVAWLFALINLAVSFTFGEFWSIGAEGAWEVLAYYVLAIICLTLSVVVMRLRQMME